MGVAASGDNMILLEKTHQYYSWSHERLTVAARGVETNILDEPRATSHSALLSVETVCYYWRNHKRPADAASGDKMKVLLEEP